MCATDIFTLEGVDHLVVGNFYLKMIFVQCLPPCQSNANKVVLLLKGDVFRAWHPRQWPTICECPVHWLLYILGHNTRNLKSTLPAIQQICQGMHQVHQTCTPMSQIQWCWSTACLASTLSYTLTLPSSIFPYWFYRFGISYCNCQLMWLVLLFIVWSQVRRFFLWESFALLTMMK